MNNARKIIFAAVLGSSSLFAPFMLSTAHAQSTTTGAIQGVVTDKATGEPLAGVTVVVTSPGLSQTQTQITDEKGTYKITDLPPGDFLVTFYYADITVEQSGVHVGVNKVTPIFQKINQAAAGGEIVHVKAEAPTIDPTSTTQGITIDKNYIKNIPVPGRTFEAALGAAAGSQNDGTGVSFSGSSSLENQYYVDGVNTTGLTFGTVGSPIINDFIEEIEVITGGYNAEYGRATGGIVNVVTKSGSNEFKGSIFGYYQPGFLTAAAKTTPRNGTSIDFTANTAYDADFGFELGGPIIKDKLWFFVGVAPAFKQVDFTRTTKRQTDCRTLADVANGIPEGNIPGLSACDKKYADSTPDFDPKTGFNLQDVVDSEIRSINSHTYNVLGKINYAATPEHQGQISGQAQPSGYRQPGLDGPAANGFVASQLTTDLSGKWTSKFNDNKTEVEAVVGWHRDSVTSDALDPTLQNEPLQVLENGDLSHWGPSFGESALTNSQCFDDTNPSSTKDPYPLITNCPIKSPRAYVIGGPGSINRDVEQRRAAKLSITQRLKLAGSHEIKAGIDAEDNISDKSRLFSGGEFITNYTGPNPTIYVNRWVQLTNMTNTDPRFDQTCNTPDPNGGNGVGSNKSISFKCAYLSGTPGSQGTQISGETLNWSAYLRDSWQIQPNLTLNAGLRYEEQYMRYASFLRNTTDPLTNEKLGTNAMTLNGNWAPRIGLLYDWTKEGRSKIYGHWGRFYESVPMDINDRSFGGEVTYEQIYSGKGCGAVDPMLNSQNGKNCMGPADLRESLIGASGVLIAPGIKAQYMDELILGFEYEIMDDLKVGVSYQNRALGRVIEDFSTDGANTYIIGNPGEFSADEEAKLADRIMRTDDPKEKQRLQHNLDLFKGSRIFDKPRRDYNALQFTLTRRFSKKLYIQGSYTYSRTEGNYPGLISYDNGQQDPNISSQYDLIELLANRVGPLPQDRPHYIKLDGYYTFDLKKAGSLTTGIRLRALSGIPENALAGHWLYGANESFLLPRGELGRTDFDHGLDIHLDYSRKISKNMTLSVFADIFNIYNRQGSAGVDDNYAPQVKLSSGGGRSGAIQNANPVSGGTYDDLIWVKTLDTNGIEAPGGVPIGRNPNFQNTNVRYAPSSGRLGLRLTF
ncbi:MAG: TonB-dependent receptor plug [Myxococcales bacterium]|nr:TonB-dependent receptor plug [Myxococcales bacterium]